MNQESELSKKYMKNRQLDTNTTTTTGTEIINMEEEIKKAYEAGFLAGMTNATKRESPLQDIYEG